MANDPGIINPTDAPANVQLPDGTIIQGVPPGTTRAQMVEKLAEKGYDVSKLTPPNPTDQYGNQTASNDMPEIRADENGMPITPGMTTVAQNAYAKAVQQKYAGNHIVPGDVQRQQAEQQQQEAQQEFSKNLAATPQAVLNRGHGPTNEYHPITPESPEAASARIATEQGESGFNHAAPEEANPWNVTAGLINAAGLTLYQQWQSLLMQHYEGQIGAPWGNKDAKILFNQAKNNYNAAEELKNQDPVFDSKTGQFLYPIAKGFAQFAPELLSFAAGPEVGIPVMFAGGETSGYGKYIARGATGEEAMQGAMAEGGIMAATSELPMSALLNKFGSTGVGQFAGKMIANGVAPLTAQGVAMSIPDYAIANPNATVGGWLKTLPDTVQQSALSALVFTGGAIAAHAAVRGTVGVFKPTEQTKAEQAATIDTITDPNKSLDESILSAHDAISESGKSVAEQLRAVRPLEVQNGAGIETETKPVLPGGVGGGGDNVPSIANADLLGKVGGGGGIPDNERTGAGNPGGAEQIGNVPRDNGAPTESGSVPAGNAAPLVERRQNSSLRKRVADMTPEERADALLMNHLTGIKNDRAYAESEKLPYQASIDVDGLKWINDNLGHDEGGDALLKNVARALATETPNAYHLHGDEFIVQGNTPQELKTALDAAQEKLKNASLSAEMNGKRVTITGLGFSYGVGHDLSSAESNMLANKAERTNLGLRAERGAQPAGVTIEDIENASEKPSTTPVGEQPGGQESIGGERRAGVGPSEQRSKSAPEGTEARTAQPEQAKVTNQPSLEDWAEYYTNKRELLPESERRSSIPSTENRRTSIPEMVADAKAHIAKIDAEYGGKNPEQRETPPFTAGEAIESLPKGLRKAALKMMERAQDNRRGGLVFGSEADNRLLAAKMLAEKKGTNAKDELASLNGQLSNSVSNQTETPEFKRWFGNSKVVDENGKPAVMYHGTSADITEFKPGQANAIFLTHDKETANKFASWPEPSGENVLPVYAKAEHPFDPDNQEDIEALRSAIGSKFPKYKGAAHSDSVDDVAQGRWMAVENPVVQNFIRKHYDGFYVYEEGQKNLAVYKPEQVKSATGNSGEFNPNEPSIIKSVGQKVNAFYHPDLGTIFVNTDNIARRDIPGVVLHEISHAADNPKLNAEVMRRLGYSEFDTDMAQQATKLEQEAHDKGYADLDEYATKDPDGFMESTKRWRSVHPLASIGIANAIKRAAVRADIAANKVLGGEEGETISARAGKEQDNSTIARVVAKTLNAVIPGHTDRAIEATKMRQAGKIAFSKSPFYSQLRRQVEAAPEKLFNNGKVAAGWLEANAPRLGIKQDELYWTGIGDWLKTQGKVSKADVLAYLDNNGVQVEEIELSAIDKEVNSKLDAMQEDIDNKRSMLDAAIESHGIGRAEHANLLIPYTYTARALRQNPELYPQDVVDAAHTYYESVFAYRKARDELDKARDELDHEKTKFSFWQLPGGNNYRELLLTLPKIGQAGHIEKEGKLYVVYDPDGKAVAYHDNEAQAQAQLAKFGTKGKFLSQHFEQPNILAHIRFNERTDAEGKRVLFLEELQSDWGQRGRKTGFASDLQNIFNIIHDSENDGLYRIKEKGFDGFVTANGMSKWDSKEEAAADLEKHISRIGKSEYATPSAPFVIDTKAWTALALKRMIAYAAENGYDRVAWTTGEQQAARYDLSKQVSAIHYAKRGDEYTLKVVRRSGDRPEAIGTYPAEKLEEVIGKDAAQKVINGEGGGVPHTPYKSLSGLDLKVGGEGMKGYYDQIVPQVANDILRKAGGGKVGETTINTAPTDEDVSTDGGESNSAKVQGFDITPELRAKVTQEGLPLFSKNAEPSGDIYSRVRSRMEAAGEQGNPKESTSYLVEEAMRMGQQAGHSRLDTGFWGWAQKVLPGPVVNVLKQWVAAVRAAMYRNGIMLKEKDLSIDDFVAIARANMKDIAFGRAETAGGEVATSKAAAATSEQPEEAPKKTKNSRLIMANEISEKPMGIKSRLISGAQDGIASVKSGLSDLLSAYRRPPEFTESKRIIGEYTGSLQEIDLKLSKLAKKLQVTLPRDRQIAMTNYKQAMGNIDLLKERASKSAPPYRKGYEDAMHLTPEEKATIKTIEDYEEQWWKEANKLGILEGHVEGYVRGQWERERVTGGGAMQGKSQAIKEQQKQRIMALINSGMLNDHPREAMKKIFANYFEGEQFGAIPSDKRIGAQFIAAQRSIQRAIAARKALTDLMHSKEKDGRPTVVIGGSGHPVSGDAADSPYFIRANTKKAESGDYRMIDHPSMRGWKYVGEDADGKPILMQGMMWVHPDAYGRLNALLGKSAIREYKIPESVPVIGGARPGDTMLRAGAFIKHTMLVGPFHQFHLAEHAVFHKINPFNPPEIDFDKRPLLRELVNHGLMLYSHNAMHEFSEGLASGGLLHKVPIAGDYLRRYQEWLFQDYIPRLKALMTEHAVDRALVYYKKDLASGKLTRDQLLDNVAKQGNAAFGEQNYKYMGRNPTLQDALRIGLLAPDFLESRFKFFGQAARPYGKEQTMALVRGAIIMGAIAQTMNVLFGDDHKMHWDRPFSVIIGGREYTPRSVVGDMVHLVEDPRGFWFHRINPLWGRPIYELATGKDINGQKESLSDAAKNILESWTPIPAQGIYKNNQGQTLLQNVRNTLLQSIGVTNFPYKTDAEKLVSNIQFDHRSIGAESPERKKSIKNFIDLRDEYMSGELNSMDDVFKKAAANNITLTRGQARLIAESRTEDRFAVMTRRMRSFNAEEAMRVWESMSDEEKTHLQPVVLNKLHSAKTMDQDERNSFIDEVMKFHATGQEKMSSILGR